ncbi:MAG TPA: hypothetical protein VE800_06150 [Actinomycetota bacterium]|nr:hypothetical protein [Actinomycetota bacterium]
MRWLAGAPRLLGPCPREGFVGEEPLEKAEFEAEADRLLGLARDAGVTLRLLGAVAFARRCPNHAYLRERLGRHYTDIDFAAYGREADRVREMLAGAGYVDDPHVYVGSEGTRLVAEHAGIGMHIDVFFDKLEFCHTVPWKGRLELDAETIPLAELLLQKMQIVEINEKDLIDAITLLLEFPLGDTDRNTINIARVAQLCAKDWGWWRTLTMNLDKVRQMAEHYEQLTDEETARVRDQVRAAFDRIDAEPKSMSWKLRARIGDRKKWYRDVGELTPMTGEG